MFDECTDVLTKEQMAVVASYNVFSNENVQVKERFLELLECDTGTTGEAICTKIKTLVADLGLDPTGLRAITTDGAGNMCGHLRGVVTRLRDLSQIDPHSLLQSCA